MQKMNTTLHLEPWKPDMNPQTSSSLLEIKHLQYGCGVRLLCTLLGKKCHHDLVQKQMFRERFHYRYTQ